MTSTTPPQKNIASLAKRDGRLKRRPSESSEGAISAKEPITMNTATQPPPNRNNRGLISAAMTLAAALINLLNNHWPF